MENYKFNQNKNCEFFPCHEVKDAEKFNCLFCYCPLYMLKEACGGNYQYTESGIKDCSNCTITHSPGGYEFVMGKMGMVMEGGKK